MKKTQSKKNKREKIFKFDFARDLGNFIKFQYETEEYLPYPYMIIPHIRNSENSSAYILSFRDDNQIQWFYGKYAFDLEGLKSLEYSMEPHELFCEFFVYEEVLNEKDNKIACSTWRLDSSEDIDSFVFNSLF